MQVPGQVQQASEEGCGEGPGEGAEPGKVQQGSGDGLKKAWECSERRFWRRFREGLVGSIRFQEGSVRFIGFR